MSCKILGLFEKRIDGDDALLELAQARFRRAGLGAEFYAANPDELAWLLGFRPSKEALATVHLPRGLDLLEERNRRFILDYAERFGGQLFGLVLHDQEEVGRRLQDYLAALERMESGLKAIPKSPFLFIEYAVGLEPEVFIDLFERARRFVRVSACLDTGHLGLWHVRNAYASKRAGEDVCAITPSDADLPEVIEEIQGAVGSTLEPVVGVIRAIGRFGKPLHFHLHDGHPLSTFSRFGVSDHLSFFTKIPIPFEYKGERTLGPMYGPEGLQGIVDESLSSLGQDGVSFSLEIHPTEERLPLGEDAHFFEHWKDKGNAEQMNQWISVLEANHSLVAKACENHLKKRSDR